MDSLSSTDALPIASTPTNTLAPPRYLTSPRLDSTHDQGRAANLWRRTSRSFARMSDQIA